MFNVNILTTLTNDTMDRTLKITTWYANGLDKHLQEIETFIFSQNIDILLVFESHFINKSYFRISGYILYHILHPDDKTDERTVLVI